MMCHVNTLAILIALCLCWTSDAYLKKRIINGEDESPKQNPWAVALRSTTNSNCGGSILNSRWILTAAHCVFQKEEGVPEDKDPNNWYVQAGSQKIAGEPWRSLNSNGGDPIIFRVEKILIHPQWNGLDYENDITLMKLKNEIIFEKYQGLIEPVSLPTPELGMNWPPSGLQCIMIGWGCIENEGDVVETGFKAQLPVIGPEECTRFYNSEYIDPAITPAIEFCAGFEKDATKEATCQGDSGGGLICPKDGKNYVSGVLSSGHPSEPDLFPAVLARVAPFVEWIEKTIASN